MLQNVDKGISLRHKKQIESHWESWKSDKKDHWVFWEFILFERNNFIKEFELGFTTEPYLEPGEYDVEEVVFHKQDLFRESVYWWREQLTSIELQSQ